MSQTPPPVARDLLGATWFSVRQPQAAAFAWAALHQHQALVLRTQRGTDPSGHHTDATWYSYASYPSWEHALAHTAHLPAHQRHLFELIPAGKPCKPHLDLDSQHPDPPPPCLTPLDVAQRAQTLIQHIFAHDYGIQLPPHAFFWSHSPNQNKLSMHLVVSTHHPQLLFHSNHRMDPQGAYHLARRLAELDPTCLGLLVDRNIYTSNRAMRLVGCTKAHKPLSDLRPLRPRPAAHYCSPDEIITALDQDTQVTPRLFSTKSAVEFEAPFLSSQQPGRVSDDDTFDGAVRRWMDGSAACLSIKSPMGTGKTTLLDKLLQHPDLPHDDVLIVTYRQTLALEQQNKLEHLGFVNYMTLESRDISQELHPRLICQVESLFHLEKLDGMPAYQVVVVDEVELVLQHFNSPTVESPARTMEMFVELLQKSRRIVTLDAFWGNGAHEFLEAIQVSNVLCVNGYGGSQRHFKVVGHRKRWLRKLLDDLAGGKNVVVVSMSTAQIDRVKEAVLAVGAVGEGELLVHQADQDSETKMKLAEVNGLWVKYRLVLYSPTISAGVDFSVPHFDRMYVYMCVKSTVALGLIQMTGRVRRLADESVYCLAGSGVEAVSSCRPALPGEMMDYLRWLDCGALKRRERVALTAGERGAMAVTSSDAPGKVERLKLCKRTALTLVQARYLAARHDADNRFLASFTELAKSAGHTVTWTDSCYAAPSLGREVEAPGAKDYKVEKLLSVPDVSYAQHGEIFGRILSNCATKEDHLKSARYFYRRAFGLARLDEEFLKYHGGHLDAAKGRLRVLIETLYPEKTLDDGDVQVASRELSAMSPIVRRVVSGLGFKSPFDDGKMLADVWKAYEENVAGSEEFRDVRTVLQLFTKRSTQRSEVTKGNVVSVMNKCLEQAGLRLAYTSTRTRGVAGDTGKRHKVYMLDHGPYLELVRLKLRHDNRRLDLPNEHARAALWGEDGALGGRLEDYPKHGRLIEVEEGGGGGLMWGAAAAVA